MRRREAEEHVRVMQCDTVQPAISDFQDEERKP